MTATATKAHRADRTAGPGHRARRPVTARQRHRRAARAGSPDPALRPWRPRPLRAPRNPTAELRVHDAAAYLAVRRPFSAGLGWSYAEGAWDCDDLTAFLRLASWAVASLTTRPAAAWLPGHPRRSSTPSVCAGKVPDPGPPRPANNIRAPLLPGQRVLRHLPRPDHDLQLGDLRGQPTPPSSRPRPSKLDRLCRLLESAPRRPPVSRSARAGASFARHAARKLRMPSDDHHQPSAEQFEWARQACGRRRPEPIGSRCCNDDYRQLSGHLRQARLDRDDRGGRLARPRRLIFATCTRLLRPDGLMGLQAIVIPGNRWARAKHTRDFCSRPTSSRGAACPPSSSIPRLDRPG